VTIVKAKAGPRLLIAFGVRGHPVPWSVGRLSKPKVRKRATRKGPAGSKYRIPSKNPALMSWQQEVNLRAKLAMAGRLPYAGPVTLAVTFRVMHRGGRKVGDVSNLTKGLEDALQGAVIVNDSQVCGVTMAREMVGRTTDEGAWVEVFVADPGL
jgi:Holliday junction resolvase RusA-like endonuclease